MGKKRIENYIPKAIEVIEKEFKGESIPKVYKSYISSFGASIVQSGLKPTLAFYEKDDNVSQGDKGSKHDKGPKHDRSRLSRMILKLIDDSEGSLLRYVIEEEEQGKDGRSLREKIKDAAIAIKLALRTFKLSEDSGGNDEG
ncbi:type III-B CRISPR module-associated protein Cmr5 [Halonatronum saccharophilum]|uniref:type III-B CRISPR module-associated protein Cmr5 n=1 Tax=Halonatronum saccharophilum TaxID=150060 RepID=UPI000489952E|nr:type III-B CRISPR module-associated protein Cmr5 [Halonatronum saccharophilum]